MRLVFLQFLIYNRYSLKNMFMNDMRPYYVIKIIISDFVHNYVLLSLEENKIKYYIKDNE